MHHICLVMVCRLSPPVKGPETTAPSPVCITQPQPFLRAAEFRIWSGATHLPGVMVTAQLVPSSLTSSKDWLTRWASLDSTNKRVCHPANLPPFLVRK